MKQKPQGVAVEPLAQPGSESLRFLETQVLELKVLQQAAAELRAKVIRAEQRAEQAEERAGRSDSLLALAREELSRVAADAMLPRSVELLLAKRNAEIRFEQTADMKTQVYGFCRGAGPQVAGSIAELAAKLLPKTDGW